MNLMDSCISLIVTDASRDVALRAKPTSIFVTFNGSETKTKPTLTRGVLAAELSPTYLKKEGYQTITFVIWVNVLYLNKRFLFITRCDV